MAFDTFDEGISLGGMRSKTEIRTLICYMLKSVGFPMSKENVIAALMEKGLANYFETGACFEDLIRNGNIAMNEDNLYHLTPAGELIARELEDTLAPTVRERAVQCALSLIEQERREKENKVVITKTENGFTDTCTTCRPNGEDASKRLEIKHLIADLAKKNPQIEQNIFRSMENINLKSVLSYKCDGEVHSFLDGYDD